MLPLLRRLLFLLLALLLGLTLLGRGLEWYRDRLADLSSTGARTSAPAPPKPPTSPPTQHPSPSPGASHAATQVSPGASAASDVEDQPSVISVRGGAAFAVAPGLYATSESLTDGYGHLADMIVPGGLGVGKVVAYDRENSGIAIVADDHPPLPPMTLAGAASLGPGERLRSLYPIPSAIPGRALPTPGVFGGIRLRERVVLLDLTLSDPLLTGSPILDGADRVVGIVVGRRDQ